ncbi:MAG: LOG family protein [Acidimicrobiales bacterium]
MTDPAVEAFLSESGLVDVANDVEVARVRDLLEDVSSLVQSGHDVRDLRVAATAMRELLIAARLFSPWHDRPKLTVFGSARTPANSPLYVMARSLSARMAARGWMTVSGAGPGIMQAAAEGAGLDDTLGVNITLPFEQSSNPYVDAESRLVEMKYFFTRKVALTKESLAFVFFPGGLGTMDEVFEILTLLHTGKGGPAPVLLVDTAEGTYWESWQRFIDESVIDTGYLDEDAAVLFKRCHSLDEVEREIDHFYTNFTEFTLSSGRGRIGLRRPLTIDECVVLEHRVPELATGDGLRVEANALTFDFDGRRYVELRRLIDAVNDLG